MGLFSGPWQSKEEYERGVHLNLISRINSLELNCLELGAKLQVAQGRVEELEAMLKLSADFASRQHSLGKEFEKILFDNLDDLYVTDPALEKGD